MKRKFLISCLAVGIMIPATMRLSIHANEYLPDQNVISEQSESEEIATLKVNVVDDDGEILLTKEFSQKGTNVVYFNTDDIIDEMPETIQVGELTYVIYGYPLSASIGVVTGTTLTLDLGVKLVEESQLKTATLTVNVINEENNTIFTKEITKRSLALNFSMYFKMSEIQAEMPETIQVDDLTYEIYGYPSSSIIRVDESTDFKSTIDVQARLVKTDEGEDIPWTDLEPSTPIEKEDTESPDTSDVSNIAMFGTSALASLSSLAYVLKRKNRK